MIKRIAPVACFVLTSCISSALAVDYTSAASGLWDATNTITWSPAGNPQTGAGDSVSILTGHTVEFSGASGVGLAGSGDLGVANGNVININGGVLTQSPAGYWIRIGHGSDGTMNINDGRFHFTNNTGAGGASLQVGIRGGNGFLNIGDGIGAAGSAVLNLRDVVNGTANAATIDLNLAATEGTNTIGSGTIVIKSDGVLEGDVRSASSNPVIRVGQGTTAAQSSITVNAGGQFRAHGTVEIGSSTGATGLIRINGAGARLDQDIGEFDIGFNGAASLIIENGGVYSRSNTSFERLDQLIGREAASVATVVVQSGGQFLRGAGGNVGDMRIGLRGTGTMIINDGGLVQNDSGNWDWIGQESGSHGTLTINSGGIFRTTGGSNLIVGNKTGATGLVEVKGGTLDLQNTGSAQLGIGQNGDGTFRQVSGSSTVQGVQMAENGGTATFDLQGGTFTARSGFFLGGANNTSTGTGSATATQSGGSLTIGGAFVTGLAGGHTATYTLTGGTIAHTGSDVSVGESGTGTLTIGPAGTLTDTAGGQFFVGRNEGSSGTLLVNGALTRTAPNAIRVGNGDSTGTDNTTAPGLLGGTGSISSAVRIGSHGTLTGGTFTGVGALSITGDLSFSSGGLLYANIDNVGNADRINLFGAADITGAQLGGSWVGGITAPQTRYWLLVNDGTDAITGSFANVSATSPSASIFPNADGWITIGGQEFAVFYKADSTTNSLTGGNDLAVAPVPEPSSALLIGSGVAMAFARRRRNRR